MSDLPVLCGIGGTFAIAGKTYTWSPLTIGDMAAFEAELRAALADRLDMIGPAKAACDAAGLKENDRRSVMEQAAREHLRLRTLGPFRLLDEFRVPSADAVLFRRHLLKHHPDITLEAVKSMVGTHVVSQVMKIMLDQARSVLPGKGNGPRSDEHAGSTPPTAAAAKTRRTPNGVSSSGTSRRSATSRTPKS